MTGAEARATAVITTIYPNPCILPHSMDPTSTDFRAFFPYTPNEVKHRKRTTSAQLKVLETIFKSDTKPNASRRKDLASQLDMTARGVQVWFQNRRAKEKNKASKAAHGAGKLAPGEVDQQQLEESPSPSAEPTDTTAESLNTTDIADASSQPPSPVDVGRPFFHINTHNPVTADSSANTSWQSSPIDPPTSISSFASRSSNNLSDIPISSYRRGSLPVNALLPTSSTQLSYGPPLIDQYDPLARRRSVDASLQRLAHNPYAGVARARNAQLFGSTRIVAHGHHHPAVYYGPGGRPNVQHRSTVPPEMDLRRAAGHTSRMSSLTPCESGRLSVPNHLVSQRPNTQPLPGPLPSPDFSFGAPYPDSSPPLTTPALDDRSSPDSFQFNYRSDELETEDDSSFGGPSRFGSLVSVASDSSTFYSTEGMCGLEDRPDIKFMRRDSCAPVFLDMMKGLGVNPLSSHRSDSQLSTSYADAGTPNASSVPPADTQDIIEESNEYPSPATTVSPGGSPPALQTSTASKNNVLISRSSELAYALQEPKAEVPTPPASHPDLLPSLAQSADPNASTSHSEFSDASLRHTYGIYEQEPSYAVPTGSNVPIYTDKYPFEPEYPIVPVTVSPPEHYHTPDMYSNSPAAAGMTTLPNENPGMHMSHQHGHDYMQCDGMYGHGDGVDIVGSEQRSSSAMDVLRNVGNAFRTDPFCGTRGKV
ncbi:Homeobox domain-containing protein [Pleurotus pulmonarius]